MTNMCDHISLNGFIEIAFCKVKVVSVDLFCFGFFYFNGMPNALHNRARIRFTWSSRISNHPSIALS